MFRAILTLFACSSALTMTASAGVTIDKVAYGGWPNCYRVANGEVEMIVTTDVGPRIIRYGFVNGQNFLKEFADQMGKSGESAWQARGGHRLWMAPEHPKDTYALDNGPVKAEVRGRQLELTQPVEPETGLQKSMILRMAETGSKVEILHRIRNAGQKARSMAPWALTMMAQGGVAIVALPPRGTHPENLLPTNPLVMWAYTDFGDPRWKFTSKYFLLRQDKAITSPQKTGSWNADTVAAYQLGTELFVKRSKADPAKRYPDFGCSFETFTNNEFLELETLGPLEDLKPGSTVEHVETWSLHKDSAIGRWTDAEIDRVLLPLLK